MKAKIIITLIAVSLINKGFTQSPVGGFLQQKGKGSVALSYTTESYEDVFLVPAKVTGVPIFKKVTTTSASLYTTYGLSNKIEAVVSVPYIKSTGQASDAVLNDLKYSNERSGLQDLSVHLKFKAYSTKIGSSTLDFIGVAGVSLPVGDYAVNEGLQSIIAIGNRATKINTIGIAHLKTKDGIFLTGQAGYSFRNNDVPSAFINELKFGYAGKAVYFDAWVANQISESKGVDILQQGFTGFFPATRVNYTRIGVNLYVPIYKGLGIAGGVNGYVQGRNLGQSTGVSGAVIYSF